MGADPVWRVSRLSLAGMGRRAGLMRMRCLVGCWWEVTRQEGISNASADLAIEKQKLGKGILLKKISGVVEFGVMQAG